MDLAAQLGHIAHSLGHAPLEPLVGHSGRFNMQGHLVVGHFTGHHQTGLGHLWNAFDNFGHLAGVHKHAADLGGLVSTAHPAFDALAGAARGASARQDGRQVSRAETDQWVIGVEHRDHHFTDLTIGHRVSGARSHDLDDHALVDHQTFTCRSFISNQAHIGGGIALIGRHALLGEPVAQ